MRTKLVLYHANCADGFGAALVAWQVFVEEADYLAVSYGEPPPEIGEHVEEIYVLDFSYPAAVLLAWAERRKVVVIDHHKTAQQDLEHLGSRGNLDIRFDLQKSGAVLAWEWFRDEDKIDGNPVIGGVPELLQYVQDRDLWRWELPSSREVSAALATYPREFSAWDTLMWSANGVPKLKNEGRPILKAQAAMVEMIVQNRLVTTIRDEHGRNLLVPIVNTCTLISECCHRMLELDPLADIVAAYFDKQHPTKRPQGARQRIYSLRSRPGGVDCSAIAKAHGGGGHPQAAGFEEEISDDWQPISTAPKSTGDPATGYVRGIYLLGFVPDPEACDPESCTSVIWWEPLTEGRDGKLGCWYGQEAIEVHPTYWRRLPATLPV